MIVKLFIEHGHVPADKNLRIAYNKKLRNAELKQFVINILNYNQKENYDFTNFLMTFFCEKKLNKLSGQQTGVNIDVRLKRAEERQKQRGDNAIAPKCSNVQNVQWTIFPHAGARTLLYKGNTLYGAANTDNTNIDYDDEAFENILDDGK